MAEMSRDIGMCVEAVHYIVQSRVLRRHLGKIRGASAADHQNVNLVCHLLKIVRMTDFNAFTGDPDSLRVTSCKYSGKFLVGIHINCLLDPFAKVAVTKDANSNTHVPFLLLMHETILIKKRAAEAGAYQDQEMRKF